MKKNLRKIERKKILEEEMRKNLIRRKLQKQKTPIKGHEEERKSKCQ